MLLISRKLGEVIYIGDNIKLTVTEIGNTKVRIGITAPPEISITREELLRYDDPRLKIEDRSK